MTRREKLSPRDAFRGNMADADVLLSFARAFQNNRTRRMRRELRDRVGEAIKVPVRDRVLMDCLESSDLFVVFRDVNHLGPDKFRDLRPLLRPAVVAGCAAFETYVADKVMEFVGAALKADELPKRLRDIPLTVGRWADIEKQYKRRHWGIRGVIEDSVREMSSTASNKVGATLGVIGFGKWAAAVDCARKVSKGTTVQQLDSFTSRRNQIAHSADRKGHGRASLEIDDVERMLSQIREIVEALDSALDSHSL